MSFFILATNSERGWKLGCDRAWDDRIAAGELRPQAIPKPAADANDPRCFVPGAGQHHTACRDDCDRRPTERMR